jgi:hypothetical protein
MRDGTIREGIADYMSMSPAGEEKASVKCFLAFGRPKVLRYFESAAETPYVRAPHNRPK